jgi:hypothetical protein
MPIKFKCGCGHVLSVPDSAAGKSGKCPKCQKVLRVPTPAASKTAGKSNTAAPAQAGKAVGKVAKPVPAAASPGVMDSLFDEAGLVQKTGPVCPKCATSIKPGAVMCTNCGFRFETGEQLAGFDVMSQKPEFDNLFLQEASNNMQRDGAMDLRRDRAAMPWWVLMSFLIGAITLCAAGVVIVDGKFGTPSAPGTFIGNVQRLPVFSVLGITAGITGLAIVFFAHLSICFFGFTKSLAQGFACFFLPLIYSFIYGIMNWTDNKAPVKAIMMALVFIGLGVFLIIQGGGFGIIQDLF